MTGRRRGGRVSDAFATDALDLFPPEPPSARARGPRAATRAPLVAGDAGSAAAHLQSVTVTSPSGEALTVQTAYAVAVERAAVGEPRAPETAIPGASPASAVAVSTLTQTLKDVVEGAFIPLWFRGEVTDFKRHRNGHWYFCLRDQVAQVRCVMWGRDAARLPAAPDDGMQVVALGQVGVYAARGELQVSIKTLQAQGDGLWRKALEATRARLADDGLLDPARRRPLPRYPRRVAVITSPDGAALHDILAVVRRRCPSLELVVVPAKVQGDGAAEELRAAVERVGRWRDLDAVIIGRGGGGREDLWAFNDERLARALAACPVPTISAVGHEVDVSICDLVADLRAPTPSAAAEAVTPVLAELQDEVAALGAALCEAAGWQVARAGERLELAGRSLATAAARVTERRRAAVETVAGRLHALSPLATLSRGFAVARADDGRALTRAAHFAPGEPFTLQLHDGRVRATAGAVAPDASAVARDAIA